MANTDNSSLERYSIITEKNPREITLLRGNGCKWLKCRFCNYHLDRCPDEEQNFILNKEVLDRVSGIYANLKLLTLAVL